MAEVTERSFDLQSWQGLTELLKVARESSVLSPTEYAAFRNIVLEYSQKKGTDQALKKRIDAVIEKLNTPPPKKEGGEEKKKHDTHGRRVVPSFTVVPEVPKKKPVHHKEEKHTPPPPPSPPAPAPEPVKEATPPPPPVVEEREQVPPPPSPAPTTEARHVIPAPPDVHRARIMEIKRHINSLVGNPVSLVDHGNHIGRDYMTALLGALKATSPGSTMNAESAMQVLEDSYAAILVKISAGAGGGSSEAMPPPPAPAPTPVPEPLPPPPPPAPEPEPEPVFVPPPAPEPVPEPVFVPPPPPPPEPEPEPEPEPVFVPPPPPPEPEPESEPLPPPPPPPPPVPEPEPEPEPLPPPPPPVPEPVFVPPPPPPEPEPEPEPVFVPPPPPPPEPVFVPPPPPIREPEPPPREEDDMSRAFEPVPQVEERVPEEEVPDVPSLQDKLRARIETLKHERAKEVPHETQKETSPSPQGGLADEALKKKIIALREELKAKKEAHAQSKREVPAPAPIPSVVDIEESPTPIAPRASRDIAESPHGDHDTAKSSHWNMNAENGMGNDDLDLKALTRRPTSSNTGITLGTPQAELASPAVTMALTELLHEWNIFASSGLFGMGPGGVEHPLYIRLSKLPMGEVVMGRFEDADPKVVRSIKDYVDAWRHEQGVAYNATETFEHYLRRVAQRILKRQNGIR